MAIEAPYNYSEKHDEYLTKLVNAARDDIKDNNDDRLYIVVGPTGVGKSMLAFHIVDDYTLGEVHMDYLAASRESFAVAIKKLKDKFEQGNKGLPLWFDEADSDNLEQNAKWNKRLFSLYMKIRFLNGFHIWCWPSLKAVDRRFVEERVNGIFFCYTKEQNKPRSYAFFPKQSILRMIDNKLPLNYFNLRKQKEKYAAWIGKYRDYTGKLKEEYLKIKHDGGFDAVDDFFNDFGDDKEVKEKNGYTRADIEKRSGFSKGKFDYHWNEGKKKGLISQEDLHTDEELQYILSKANKNVLVIPKYVTFGGDAPDYARPVGRPLINARQEKKLEMKE